MATGGLEADLFECSICLMDMVDRTPRGLPCMHSFCEECLEQLIKNNKIICPTCRKPTELKENNVKELPVNFVLNKVRELSLTKSRKLPLNEEQSKTPCQVCRENVPEFKCTKCQRIMCPSCKTAHEKIKEYKDHEVFDLCQKHEDHITHLCMKCVIPLCMSCMLVEHHHHNESFMELNEAIKNIEADVDKLDNTLETKMSQMDFYMEQVENRAKTNGDIEVNLEKQRKYHMDKIKEIDALLLTTKNNKRIFDKLTDECGETRNKCEIVAASLRTLTKDRSGLCTRYAKLQDKAENQIKAVTALLEAKHDTPMFVLNEHIPVEVVKSTEPGDITSTMVRKELKMSKVVLNIPKSKKITCSQQIDFIGSDIVVPTHNEPYHVVRLNPQGQVVDRYYPSIEGQWVTGVNVYNNNIYIVQNKAITVISPKDKTTIAIYKPNIDSMYKILVKDQNTLFIAEYTNPGNIYKYDTNRDKTEIMVKNLIDPSYINMVNSKDGIRYIVSETFGHSVRVYDETWSSLYRFGTEGPGDNQFRCPRATAVTPIGTLLIADQNNNRISHYSLDGKLLSHVITEQDGVEYPVGIAFRYPYLWICSGGQYVKCFQVE